MALLQVFFKCAGCGGDVEGDHIKTPTGPGHSKTSVVFDFKMKKCIGCGVSDFSRARRVEYATLMADPDWNTIAIRKKGLK